MSAPVTEAHIELAETALFSRDKAGRLLTAPMAAQLIADSEAKALNSLAMVTAELADRNVSLRLERDQLTDALDMMRDEFMRIIACPGCNAEIGDLANRAQLELIQRVPVIVQRDDAERKARNAEYMAKKAEAELADEAIALRDMMSERDAAEAELAKERARLDWLEGHGWITGEPCDRAAIDAAIKEGAK